MIGSIAYLNLAVHGRFLAVILLVVIGVHADVVEGELLLYTVLEHLPLLQCQAVRLGNHGNNVHRLRELLQHDDIDWLQSMASRRDEVETAVDSRVLDVPLTLGSELFA